MIDSPAGTPTMSRPPGAHWPSVRILVDFLLDIAEIARNGGSILDVLIVTVVVEANLADMASDPELQARYAGLASPPPDALRRPVRVSAVAAAIGLPHETVRRRLIRLAELGECAIGPRGVVISTARLASPDYARIAVERYARTRRLYEDLLEAGALTEMAPEDRRDVPADAPVRLCNRLLSDYYLRTLKLLMPRVGDPLAALILLGVTRANLEGQSPEARAATEVLPDAARKPARRLAIAAQMGLPAETVRRRLIDLERRGYCRTAPGGVVLEGKALLRPEALTLFQENQVNLVRFFLQLSQGGVLARWDAERAHEGSRRAPA
jgi:DNA-binding Lrp family transcriptional regulator